MSFTVNVNMDDHWQERHKKHVKFS